MKRVLIAFALLMVTMKSAQATVIGVTATSLVTIDPAHPANVTIIGQHHLPSNIAPFNSLTYNPVSQKVFGLGQAVSGSPIDEYLIEYDLHTGQGTVRATIGSNPTHFEALEYDSALGILVASRTGIPNDGNTSDLVQMNTDGTTLLLESTGLDNDFAVYDSNRNIFYTSDSNDVGQLVKVDFHAHSTSNVGAIPMVIDEAAYSSDGDFIFACSEITHGPCYRLQLINGGGPITATPVGSLGGERILGIAFVPAGGLVAAAVPALDAWGLILLVMTLGCAGYLRARNIRQQRLGS